MAIIKLQQEDLVEIVDHYAISKLDELVYEAKTFALHPLKHNNKRYYELI